MSEDRAPDALKLFSSSPKASLYRWGNEGGYERWIASTKQTRSICNDPQVAGIQYTDQLREACAEILKISGLPLEETSSFVINILRGGLNFGLRNALNDAFGWTKHTTCFISAQRARDNADSEEWHITENAYRKVYFPPEVSLIIGDVVATGTSLRYALEELLRAAKDARSSIRDIIFFTFGGHNADVILREIDARCREIFPNYRRTILIYLEGCFEVPDTTAPLTIRLTGTDLVRRDAIMAPEFSESQYEDPAFPLERCVIYDAGSRAFWVREYAADVRAYWEQVLHLAERGISFRDYLQERFPELDPNRYGDISLKELALRQIERIKPFLY